MNQEITVEAILAQAAYQCSLRDAVEDIAVKEKLKKELYNDVCVMAITSEEEFTRRRGSSSSATEKDANCIDVKVETASIKVGRW